MRQIGLASLDEEHHSSSHPYPLIRPLCSVEKTGYQQLHQWEVSTLVEEQRKKDWEDIRWTKSAKEQAEKGPEKAMVMNFCILLRNEAQLPFWAMTLTLRCILLSWSSLQSFQTVRGLASRHCRVQNYYPLKLQSAIIRISTINNLLLLSLRKHRCWAIVMFSVFLPCW